MKTQVYVHKNDRIKNSGKAIVHAVYCNFFSKFVMTSHRLVKPLFVIT